jgi:hypothetical protein
MKSSTMPAGAGRPTMSQPWPNAAGSATVRFRAVPVRRESSSPTR